MATFRLLFYDEFQNDKFAEDMGVKFDSAEDARAYAEANWTEASQDGELPYAGDIEWDGPVGTTEYKIEYLRDNFTCRYIVYTP